MSKVDLVRDLLVKINKVFSDDMFIIRNRIAVGGIDSFVKNTGRYVCLLNENIKQEYDAFLGVDSITKITNIREAKNNFKDNMVCVNSIEEFDGTDQEEIAANLAVYDGAMEVDVWHSLEEEMDEDDIDIIFNKGGIATILKDDEQPFELGKSLLPLVTEKNLSDVFFSDFKECEQDIRKIYFKIDHPYFVLYLCYWILRV